MKVALGQGRMGFTGRVNSDQRALIRAIICLTDPPTPNRERLALVPMAVGTYHALYQFEVRTAELPDESQGSPCYVLRNLSKYVVQMHLASTKDLLSKVGQAYPGTPITVDGLFTPRSRQFVILSVDMFHLDEHMVRDQAAQ